MAPRYARPLLRRPAIGRRLRLLWAALGLLAAALPAEPESPLPPASAGAPRITAARSRTRRFLAIAPDDLTKLALLQWAEETAGRFENMVRMKMPFGQRTVRLVVREPGTAEPTRIKTATSISDGSLVQRCFLPEYSRIVWVDAQEALCRLFVEGFVLDRVAARQPGKPASPRWLPARLPAAPPWLTEGLSQNLNPSLRAQNSKLVMDQWQDGKIASAAEVLRRGSLPGNPAAAGMNDPDRAACGLFVGWMLSLSNRTECLDCLFTQLASGQTVTPEVLVRCVPGCGSVSDLDERWDRWVLRQKRIVYEPGVATLRQVRQLRGELLLYPGVSGTPETGWSGRPLTQRDLIAQRGAPWAATAAKLQVYRLQALAAGRGPEFSAVVESYCRFLEALAAGKRRGRLEKLLAEADGKFRALEKNLGSAP